MHLIIVGGHFCIIRECRLLCFVLSSFCVLSVFLWKKEVLVLQCGFIYPQIAKWSFWIIFQNCWNLNNYIRTVIFLPHKINIINTISGVLLFKVHCQFECQDIISRNGKYVIPKNNCFLVALSCLKEHFVWDFSNTPHRWTDTQSCSVGLADVKLSPFIDITLFDTQT